MKYTDLMKQHILMITNHGIHEWNITPGLIDTGGQNLFVNQFADTLASIGFKVTIANRGGYPHPETGIEQAGVKEKDSNKSIVYLDDGLKKFVRKEDMHEQINKLGRALAEHIAACDKRPDIIISHYWDGAAVVFRALEILETDIMHIWVPHSLGAIKSRKTTADENSALRMDERITAERRILKSIDTVVSTSEVVRQSLLVDYDYKGAISFIPPCIDDSRFRPLAVDDGHPVYAELAGGISGSSPVISSRTRIITEVSRTDRTKRKNVLIKAFACIMDEFPDAILAVTIEKESKIGKELMDLIDSVGAAARISVLGSVWELLPALYNISDIYCSPSVMEGFGMSVQEAAACRTAVVASELIPFAVEYLAPANGTGRPGALLAAADDVDGFSQALRRLLSDRELLNDTAERAYEITIPDFTWPPMVSRFLDELEIPDSRGMHDADL